MARKRFVFSDKKNPEKGLFSVFLGVISLLGVLGSLLVSYRSEGKISPRLGAVVFLSVFFAVTGLIMAIRAHMEHDVLLLFPKIGIALNALTVLICGIILYMGV